MPRHEPGHFQPDRGVDERVEVGGRVFEGECVRIGEGLDYEDEKLRGEGKERW